MVSWLWSDANVVRKCHEVYRSSLGADKPRYVKFTTTLLDQGVRALERGAWFLSDAHSDEVIDETIAAVATTARAI